MAGAKCHPDYREHPADPRVVIDRHIEKVAVQHKRGLLTDFEFAEAIIETHVEHCPGCSTCARHVGPPKVERGGIA